MRATPEWSSSISARNSASLFRSASSATFAAVMSRTTATAPVIAPAPSSTGAQLNWRWRRTTARAMAHDLLAANDFAGANGPKQRRLVRRSHPSVGVVDVDVRQYVLDRLPLELLQSHPRDVRQVDEVHPPGRVADPDLVGDAFDDA